MTYTTSISNFIINKKNMAKNYKLMLPHNKHFSELLDNSQQETNYELYYVEAMGWDSCLACVSLILSQNHTFL